MKKIIQLLTVNLILLFSFGTAKAYDLVVAQDGSGSHTTVQAAINAAPTGRTSPYFIYIKNGKYKEKITIPSNKPFLYLIGESVANTILYYTDGASTSNGSGGTLGTQGSASVTVNAADFTAQNITFQNTFGDGSQAVAIVINADRSAFKNCRFMGNQDTLYTKGTGAPRAYFKNCYIDGNIDFIFGNSIALFDSCVIYAKTRTSNGSSYITAANTPPGQAYGYVFNNCTLPSNTGGTQYYLGRPWQNSTGSSPLANNQVVFLNATYGAGQILPAGWSTWDAGTDVNLIFDAEYQSKNFDGTLAHISGRVSWSKQLDAGQAASITKANMFGSWDPCAITSTFCNDSARDIAVSNLRATKNASTTTISWNISWPMKDVIYNLIRSTDSVNYFPVDGLISENDTSVNFQFTDNVPPAGSIYYYYIEAMKAGTNNHISDTVIVSSAPTIVVTGSMGIFGQGIGTPSAPQTVSVSGTNLVGDVIITPPVDYEVSKDGTTWYNSITPLILSPTAQTLSATNVQVRLNATVLGDHSGDIILSTTGNGAKNIAVAVSGTTSAELNTSYLIQQWPLVTNNNDSAAVRYLGIQASTPTLNKLYLSTAVGVPTVPAYSAAFGQAFGASTTVDGSWSAGDGGTGGTLNRTYYEQFTIAPEPGYNARVDSIIFNTDFYNSNSNSKTAVMYSLSGFTTDSLELSGGATFTSPILTNKTTSGTVDNYRLALNGAAGVTIDGGKVLSIRLYYALGSSSPGRYGMLKNVIIKGDATPGVIPVSLLSFNATASGSSVKLNWITANEINSKDFTVEKSADGGQYTAIGTVKATNAGNYSFTDANAINGIAYYRLRINDNDGSYSSSKVVTVKTASNVFTVYPNPATNTIHLKYTALAKTATATLSSFDGKAIKTITLAQGSTKRTIDISSLASGVYSIVVNDGNVAQTVRFEKQ